MLEPGFVDSSAWAPAEESLEGDMEASDDAYGFVSFYFGLVLKSTRHEWTYVWRDKGPQ